MLQKWMGHAQLETKAIYANALGAEEQEIAARMREQRNALRRLMRRSPSLERGLEATIADVYRDALGRALDETGLSAAAFPDQLPYSVDEVLQPEPEAGALSAARRPGRRR